MFSDSPYGLRLRFITVKRYMIGLTRKTNKQTKYTVSVEIYKQDSLCSLLMMGQIKYVFSKAMKKYIKIFVAFFAGKPLRDSAPVVLVTWSHVHPLPHLQNSTFWKGKQVVTINHIFTVYTKLLIFNQLENRSRQQPWFNLAIQPF